MKVKRRYIKSSVMVLAEEVEKASKDVEDVEDVNDTEDTDDEMDDTEDEDSDNKKTSEAIDEAIEKFDLTKFDEEGKLTHYGKDIKKFLQSIGDTFEQYGLDDAYPSTKKYREKFIDSMLQYVVAVEKAKKSKEKTNPMRDIADSIMRKY